jgi:hypothetical protein
MRDSMKVFAVFDIKTGEEKHKTHAVNVLSFGILETRGEVRRSKETQRVGVVIHFGRPLGEGATT